MRRAVFPQAAGAGDVVQAQDNRERDAGRLGCSGRAGRGDEPGAVGGRIANRATVEINESGARLAIYSERWRVERWSMTAHGLARSWAAAAFAGNFLSKRVAVIETVGGRDGGRPTPSRPLQCR